VGIRGWLYIKTDGFSWMWHCGSGVDSRIINVRVGLSQIKLTCHVLSVVRTGHLYSPRESEEVCFYRRCFVCLSSVFVCVCLSVTTITKKIVDGFVPKCTGRFLVEREDQVCVSLRSMRDVEVTVRENYTCPKISLSRELYSLRVLSS